MSNRKVSGEQRSTEFFVGLFFIIGMVLLGFFTIVLNKSAIGGKETGTREIDFSAVASIKTGDKVLLRGVEVGKVTGIGLSPKDNTKVRVGITILAEYNNFYDGYVVEIRSTSVLGGVVIYMEQGPKGPKIVDGVLKGKGLMDPFKEAGELMKNLNSAMTDVKVFAASLNNKESTLYKITNEDDMYVEAKAAFTSVKEAGKTIGETVAEFKSIKTDAEKLLKDIENASKSVEKAGKSIEAMGSEIKATAKNVNEAVTEARKGKGTLGKLLTDDTAYNNFKDASAEIKKLVKNLNSGTGSLSKIMNDKGALYNNVNGSFKDLKAITEKINSGKGNLGKLVHGEGLYKEAMHTLKDVQGAINDFREQTPILTFGSFIFGAL